MDAIERLRSFEIASALARLEEFGVTIEAGPGRTGYWILRHPGPPPRMTAICFVGYATRVSARQIRTTMLNLGLDPAKFLSDER